MAVYPQDFYANRNARTVHAARTVLALVLDVIPRVESAVDVGCGVGTWLSMLREMGVPEVQGVDGPWVDRKLLVIAQESFRSTDLSQPLGLDRRYGLAISLEVAEHLPADSARGFVSSLTQLADFVLFSAAIPFQGGKGHVNEQWPEYWARLFGEFGYVAVDAVRRKIWDDPDIPYWYRQNALLYVRRERLAELRQQPEPAGGQAWSLALVHPEAYLRKIERMQTIGGSFRMLRRALRDRILRRSSAAPRRG